MRHLHRFLPICIALTACAGVLRPAHAPRVGAIASNTRAVISFPMISPDTLPWPGRSNGERYAWTFRAGFSEVVVGPTARDTTQDFKDLAHVIRASVVRRCHNPAQSMVLMCSQPLKAKIRVDHGMVIATITDTGFVHYLLRNPADSALLVTRAHGVLRIAQVRMVYSVR